MSIEALHLNGFGQNPQTRADEYDSSHSYYEEHAHHGVHAQQKRLLAQDCYCARGSGGGAEKRRGNGEE